MPRTHPPRVGTRPAPPGYNHGVCLVILLLILGPRAIIVVWWILAPLVWSATFGTLLLPLIGFLLKRPRWVAGTVLGILGWPLQLLALSFAPLVIVQPALLRVLGTGPVGSRSLGGRT